MRIKRARLSAAFFGAFLFLFSAAGAQAQSIDWVLNLNDTGSDPIPAGGVINYTLRVDNDGFDPAPATTVQVNIPNTTTLIGASGTITGCTPIPRVGPGSVLCNVPPLASSASAQVVLQVDTSSSGTVTLSASVPTAGDTNTANNALSENTTVTAGADVELTVAGPATASSGSTVTYVFTARNTGPDTLTSAQFQFPAPTGLANISPPGGCTLSAGTYTCAITGPVAVGATRTFSFGGQVSAAGGSTVTPVGSVLNGSPPDPDTSNNTATLSTSVTGGSDLSITKTRSPSGTLLVGNAVTFTLAPRYTGDNPNNITITDTIPANYSITSVTPSGGSGWSCSVGGQTVTCTRPSGSGPGANVSMGTIAIATTAVSGGSPVNTATITAAGPADPNPANNSASDGGATITAPTVDLRANKSGPNPPLVVVGNSYTFSISATNVGNAPFFGTLVMTDALPAGLTVTSYGLNGWTCGPGVPVSGPATITCQRVYTSGAPLAASATTPAVSLNATATATGSIANSMTVSSPDANIGDGNGANDTATYTITASTAGNSADISVGKTAALASVPAGDIQTFTLEVRNAGPQPSANVTLTDNFPRLINDLVGATGAGFVGVAASPGVSCSTAASTATGGGPSRRLTCSIASLPVCTSGVDCPTVTVQVRPGGDAGSPTNTATVSSSSVADPVLGNNSGSAGYTVVARADVTVTKTASPSPVVAGQNLTYVLTARNLANGLSSASAVTVTDTLPADVTFISATPSAGSCSVTPAVNSTTGPGNNTVTCNLGTIANGAQRTLTIVVRPNTVTRGTTLNNSATVSTTTTETDTTNNAAAVATPVQNPVLDILINKTDTGDPVAIGDNATYTITVTNLGPSAAENVVMTDAMPPAGLSYQSNTVPAGGSCPTIPAVGSFGGTLICQVPVLPAGQSRSFTVAVRGEAKGTYVNNVAVSSDEIVAGFDTDPLNNAADEPTTVRTRADVLVVSKAPSANPVNLRDDFDFVVTVRNNTGVGLSEADNVVLSDTLPANMQLVGVPSASVVSGTATLNSCTGAAGATSFTCSFGTLSSGAVVTITVPVEIVSVSSLPQTFTNTASITTASLDVNPANNSNSGSVSVESASIAGTVFRDFGDDGAVTGADTGVAGVTMTLTGTSFDGAPITRTVTTAADGSYIFSFIPQGTYTITRGAPGEPNLTDGTTSAGSEGGTVSSPTAISAIALPSNTAATGYLFPLIPQASVGIAKAVVAGPTANVDGSLNVTFRLTVENLALEPLTNLVVTDDLDGAVPRFGTFASLASPTTDPLAAGSYTTVSAPSGSCGGLNAGFNGAASQTVASGFGLAPGATCTIDFQLRIQPPTPLPPIRPSGGRWENQADVTGEGALTGQTPLTNPQLSDRSDNGTNADPDGDRVANETGENDPTPVGTPLSGTAEIELVKTVDDSDFIDGPDPGDTLRYTFIVANTGNVTLTNVTVTDPLPGLVLTGGPIASLAPGASDSTTYTATYVPNAGDIAAGRVDNTATAQGFYGPGGGLSVSDSASASAAVVSIQAVPEVFPPFASDGGTTTSMLASDLAGGAPATLYAGGAATPQDVTITVVATSDPGVTLDPATGLITLAPGNPAGTYTVDYEICSVLFPAVCDQTTETVTQLPLPGIEVTKTQVLTDNGDGVDGVGDTLTYTITVENTGNTPLENLTLTDTITSLASAPLALDSGPGFVSSSGGSPEGDLAIGETATYTATYTFTIASVTDGGVSNTVTAEALPVFGPGVPGAPSPVSDVSDDGIDTDGNTTDDPTVYSVAASTAASGLSIQKSTPRGVVERGSAVPYTLTVRNDNPTVAGVLDIVDALPPGFLYIDGSATLGGVPYPVTVTGRIVTWDNVAVPPLTTVTATLSARVTTGASPGEHVNRASLRDPATGALLAPVARATVRILPEAVFDCGDVIGKVFDDRNGDGYQNDPGPEPIIDDDAMFDGKLGKAAPAVLSEGFGEPGLPGIRLAGVDGTIITTDQFGRFHVPCAMLPDNRGSNFILKVDTRSLPSGYRMTTENPRVVRLTRGKMTELNFGAALVPVVRIDLNDRAFVPGDGGDQLSPALRSGIAALLPRIADEPVNLRLAYHVPESADGDAAARARSRMRLVEDHIRREWRDVGRVKLTVERTIVRASE